MRINSRVVEMIKIDKKYQYSPGNGSVVIGVANELNVTIIGEFDHLLYTLHMKYTERNPTEKNVTTKKALKREIQYYKVNQ